MVTNLCSLKYVCILIFSLTVPSGSPEDVSVIVLSSSEILVSWSEIDPISQNGIITLYEVVYSAGSSLNQSIFSNGSSFALHITGLEEDVEYSISVRAYTSVGPGSFSNVVMKTTKEDGWFFFSLLINN